MAEIVPVGRMIPFCACNSVGYREEVRERVILVEANIASATEGMPP